MSNQLSTWTNYNANLTFDCNPKYFENELNQHNVGYITKRTSHRRELEELYKKVEELGGSIESTLGGEFLVGIYIENIEEVSYKETVEEIKNVLAEYGNEFYAIQEEFDLHIYYEGEHYLLKEKEREIIRLIEQFGTVEEVILEYSDDELFVNVKYSSCNEGLDTPQDYIDCVKNYIPPHSL